MNIRVDLNYPIKDGTEVVFRSPVDCSQVTGLIVYYNEDGNTASKEFAFADAHGNNVGDIDHLFAENVVVKVILDVTTGMAFVQNADTNAYLEGRFAEAVTYATQQKLTEEQKAQARKNIGAISNNLEGEALTGVGAVQFGKGLDDYLDVRIFRGENNDKRVLFTSLYGKTTLGGLSAGVEDNDVVTVKQLNDALADERPKEVYIGYDPGTGEVSSDLTYADALELLADPVEIIAYLDISKGAHKATTQTIYRDEDRYVRFDFANLGIAELDSDGAWSFISSDDIVDDIATEYVKKFYVTPQMYGATGDGKTDDTAAIQECINKNRLRNTVFFTKGTYRITKPLRISTGTHIEAARTGVTLKPDNCDAFHMVSNSVTDDSCDGVTISNLTIVGNMTNGQLDGTEEITKYNRAFVLSTDDEGATDKPRITANVLFDRVKVMLMTGETIVCNGHAHANNIYIQNCSFTYGGKSAIEMISSDLRQINAITVRDSNISVFKEDGIRISGNNITIESCTIQAVEYGIRIDPTLSVYVGISGTNTRGYNIFSNYFEQIKKSYVYANSYYKSNEKNGFINGLSIIGNYGGVVPSDADTSCPAVKFEANAPVGYRPYSLVGGGMINGVTYASNSFAVTDKKPVLIDGGGILTRNCVFVADGNAGHNKSLYDAGRTPYTLQNMANAVVINKFEKNTGTIKLYNGYTPSSAIVTADSVTLQPQTELYCEVKNNRVVDIYVDLEYIDLETGTDGNAIVMVRRRLKNGGVATVYNKTIKRRAEINYYDLQNYGGNPVPAEDVASYEIIIQSKDNAVKVNNPVITYIN